jgi:hypothetical protein
VSGVVVVDATDTGAGNPDSLRTLLLAALALTAIPHAQAESAPGRGSIDYRYLAWQDSQPGWDRIGVDAYSTALLIPIAGKWSIGGTLTRDVVSGASPAFHTSELLAGDMDETRHGREAQLTRYFSRGMLALGVTDSQESDYTSRGWSLAGTLSTADRNTTLGFGLATSHDRIDAQHIGVNQASKDTDSWNLGITRVLTPVDIVQLDYSHYEGDGYFDDPYKFRDHRPGMRNQNVWLARWNHHFTAIDATARLDYRFYSDSFGVDAHTLALEWVQPLPRDWTLVPMLRAYAQKHADFYIEQRYPGVPTILPRGQLQTQDQRLAEFGALTYGLRVEKRIADAWRLDLQVERYEQRADWYPGTGGSPGLAPFRATMTQAGVSWAF